MIMVELPHCKIGRYGPMSLPLLEIERKEAILLAEWIILALIGDDPDNAGDLLKQLRLFEE